MNTAGHFGGNSICVSSCMMDESPSYGSWIAAALSSHLRGHLLEVGCGPGNYSAAFADLKSVDRVTAIDIDEAMITLAQQREQRRDISFSAASVESMPSAAFDSLVCANVMEHIEDDTAFIKSLTDKVVPGGKLTILVPAHQFLYSRYDEEAGHYRRYNKTMLRQVVSAADCTIDRLFYFNAIGALGWWYAFKLRQRQEVSENASRGMIRIFEKYALPLGRFGERFIRPPFGLSVVALCTRSAQAS